MISRVLAGALAVLLLVAAALGWMLHREVEQRAAADQAVATAQAANQANQQAIDALGAEIIARDRLTTEWKRRSAQSEQLAAASAARLEEIERENADLRAYMDSPIPRPAADWMWLQAGGRDQDGSGPATAAGMAPGGNPQTPQPLPVPHRAGWQWCRAVERALDSCNSNLLLLREWAATLPASAPPPPAAQGNYGLP